MVYSFSSDAISNFSPRRKESFRARYNPTPVEFDLLRSDPVNPFSNTLDRSEEEMPQPVVLDRKDNICVVILTGYRKFIFLFVKVFDRILYDL